jgi:ABC-type antimicrobial peptide transport system permease subunit
MLVRAGPDLAEVAEQVRRRIAALDPAISFVRTETLQARVDPQLRSWRLGAAVFVFAGALALLVAAAGLYGVLSYVVADRQHEIGVRLALGAGAGHVSGIVMRSSVVMAMTGLVLGAGTAVSVSHLLEPLLFQVSPHDPGVFMAVAGALFLVALLAGLGPAIRASHVDPLEVLNTD